MKAALSANLPDFGRIVAMMQFDMYHSYTVDEHTIFAMGILNGIETGALADIAPVATAAAKRNYSAAGTLRCVAAA